jgi:hypothetical protein
MNEWNMAMSNKLKEQNIIHLNNHQEDIPKSWNTFIEISIIIF